MFSVSLSLGSVTESVPARFFNFATVGGLRPRFLMTVNGMRLAKACGL
jgi:hypothetical protein